ncbi:MAG: MMPL family transporter, partial [Thermoplasmata archaeon]|nr:MMPL family transporter [Thermoplasmata archaeon]
AYWFLGRPLGEVDWRVLFFLFTILVAVGEDYNIFLLTRVREERLRGRSSTEAVVEAVGRTGGIITAAAVILASAFAILTTGDFLLLRAIGFAVATAILLDALVVRTYLVPASLQLLGERVWGKGPGGGQVSDSPGVEPKAGRAPRESTPSP